MLGCTGRYSMSTSTTRCLWPVALVGNAGLLLALVFALHSQNLQNSQNSARVDQLATQLSATRTELAVVTASEARTRAELTTARNEFSSAHRELGGVTTRVSTLESHTTMENVQHQHHMEQIQHQHRQLQSSDQKSTCVNSDKVAMAALDSSYALSQVFSGFVNGTSSAGMLPKILSAQQKLEADLKLKATAQYVHELFKNSGGGAATVA